MGVERRACRIAPAAARDLNPATPPTSTDVSMTPLGCFPRRANRNLRYLLLLSPQAPNRPLDLDSVTPDNSSRRRSGVRVPAPPPSKSITYEVPSASHIRAAAFLAASLVISIA